jgi:uncharacterized protein (DUF2461 family)
METALAYLAALEANNEREWFRANKAWRDRANAEFEGFVGS